MLRLSVEVIAKLAEKVRELAKIYPWDPFDSVDYYPPKGDEEEDVARYFFFMVAVDHRTHLPESPWEGEVNGRRLRGSDLLYRLGAIKYSEDRDFFSPERMATLTLAEVRKWLTHGGRMKEPLGLKLRYELLRDAGEKIRALYGGEVLRLVGGVKELMNAYGKGLLSSLKAFLAYNDPIEKKSFLLIKFLERRGILRIRDPENLQVPIDNHLVRLSLRTGMVEPCNNFPSNREVSWEEDVAIRSLIRRAFKKLAELSGIEPTYLDDIVWNVSRKCCRWRNANCDNCDFLGLKECPFKEVCRGYLDEGLRGLKEHRFFNTWYY
ncbi:MAG: hypothetical protein B6U69_01365 [Thermofilum sp. ex4484_15]|nr:MAG: hypothetical protein B6U69_01365 [Thermofilum sp. ex4484_15]